MEAPKWESGEGVSPSPVRVGSGAPENFFDFVLRNVKLLCILDSGAGDSTSTVIMMFGWGPLNAGGSCARPIATPLSA